MHHLIVRHLACLDYLEVWQAMRRFTEQRDENTLDELWLVEHFPVYTQGKAGKPEHLLDAGHIPVVHSDRGGQVTYHGPGQLVAYVLIDLKRKNLDIRSLVVGLENTVIETLAFYGIDAVGKREAPGVYVNDAKIAALGLHVHRGCSYHGLSLNVDMDLKPFANINPCGLNIPITQLKAWAACDMDEVKIRLEQAFMAQFSYVKSG